MPTRTRFSNQSSVWSSVVSAEGHRDRGLGPTWGEQVGMRTQQERGGRAHGAGGTWERHEHVTVLRGHRLHPRLVGHQVAPGLQKPLAEQLVWGAEWDAEPGRTRSGLHLLAPAEPIPSRSSVSILLITPQAQLHLSDPQWDAAALAKRRPSGKPPSMGAALAPTPIPQVSKTETRMHIIHF